MRGHGHWQSTLYESIGCRDISRFIPTCPRGSERCAAFDLCVNAHHGVLCGFACHVMDLVNPAFNMIGASLKSHFCVICHSLLVWDPALMPLGNCGTANKCQFSNVFLRSGRHNIALGQIHIRL